MPRPETNYPKTDPAGTEQVYFKLHILCPIVGEVIATKEARGYWHRADTLKASLLRKACGNPYVLLKLVFITADYSEWQIVS